MIGDNKKEHIIGIDLGTTNSCIAIYRGCEVIVIPNCEGSRTTPSAVAFSKDGERLIGEVARKKAIIRPKRAVTSFIRNMGTDYLMEIDDKTYYNQELVAMILRKLRKDAEDYLGESITKGVIAVPANFNYEQRQTIKDAGRIAGLEVLRIISAPTAAALAYGFDKDMDEKIMVYDLGGGTTDVSILELGDKVFEVKATRGNNHLGGIDFDQEIIDWLVCEFEKSHGFNLKNDEIAIERLKDAAEKAKIELSVGTRAWINIPFITVTVDGQQHLEVSLTRDKFDELTSDLVKKTLVPVEDAMKDASISKNELDKVIFVGGSTRIPSVQDAIKNIIGVAGYDGINRDECVAIGAAIKAGVLAGEIHDVLLFDVVPFSLGIENPGGVFTELIERNTIIPTKKSMTFSTNEDNQTVFDIHILQAENEMAKDNITMGRFQLTDIPSARCGIPQIEVTFDIDANGIVNVSAKDLGTGKSQNIVIKPTTLMSEDEVYQAVIEAEQHYSANGVV